MELDPCMLRVELENEIGSLIIIIGGVHDADDVGFESTVGNKLQANYVIRVN